MAISNIIKKRIGRELREWIFLGIRTGMRRGVSEYRSSGDIQLIKRAVDLPNRARSRIDYAISTYGQAAIVDALSVNNSGDVTIAELNAELTLLETYAQGLVDHVNVDGWTWDQVATDIESNIELENVKWKFPLPPGYIDIWGE